MMETTKVLVPSLTYERGQEIEVVDQLRETIKECRERLKLNEDYILMHKAQNELNKIFYRWHKP